MVETCLEAFAYLPSLEGIEAEVVVADNASSDGTPELIEDLASARPELPIRLVRSSLNGGWGAGNNIAVASRSYDPDYVLLCNPDAQIGPQALRALLDALVSGPAGAAIAVPFVQGPRGELLGANPEWNFAKFAFWDLGGNQYPFRRFQNRYRLRRGIFRVPDGYASGALALVSFAALRNAGFFDEDLFLFNDDIDLTRRIRARGGVLVGNRDALAFHTGGVGSRIGVEQTDGVTLPILALESELVFVEKWHGRQAAYFLALYRAHAFYRIQRLLMVAMRRTPLDTAPLREVAHRYLRNRRKRTSPADYDTAAL